MLKLKRLLVVFVVSAYTSGCATIFNGSTQNVGISSDPASATVWVNGEKIGVTPLQAELVSKDHQNIKIELAGYEPYETQLTSSISGWVLGSVLLAGVIGLGVDAVTGSMFKLTPKQVSAELAAGNAQAVKQTEDGLYVFVTLKPNAEWTQIGALTPRR